MSKNTTSSKEATLVQSDSSSDSDSSESDSASHSESIEEQDQDFVNTYLQLEQVIYCNNCHKAIKVKRELPELSGQLCRLHNRDCPEPATVIHPEDQHHRH